MLIQVGAPVDGRDKREWTPLMHAADQGKAAAAYALLALGADCMLINDGQNSALELCWDIEARRARRARLCRSAAPPSPVSGWSNVDEEGVSAK